MRWLRIVYITIASFFLFSNVFADTPVNASLSSGSVLMDIPGVDLDRVRDVWLSLHNAERASSSLPLFSYHPALESTATVWAHHLADINAISNMHKRKPGDGYYSYRSIKSWFIDQGIVFPGTRPLFTENIGWNYYTCKKTDCTDDFIKAIKKSWNLFLNEKNRRYRPHYNAIVGNYSQIGLGVALHGNKYYLVTHYTQDLQ